MITKQEREKGFRLDLAELLKKHGAEISITDDGKPFGFHSAICEVYLDAKMDEEFNVTHEYTEFNL